jgi:hypothetical protein
VPEPVSVRTTVLWLFEMVSVHVLDWLLPIVHAARLAVLGLKRRLLKAALARYSGVPGLPAFPPLSRDNSEVGKCGCQTSGS